MVSYRNCVISRLCHTDIPRYTSEKAETSFLLFCHIDIPKCVFLSIHLSFYMTLTQSLYDTVSKWHSLYKKLTNSVSKWHKRERNFGVSIWHSFYIKAQCNSVSIWHKQLSIWHSNVAVRHNLKKKNKYRSLYMTKTNLIFYERMVYSVYMTQFLYDTNR